MRWLECKTNKEVMQDEDVRGVGLMMGIKNPIGKKKSYTARKGKVGGTAKKMPSEAVSMVEQAVPVGGGPGGHKPSEVLAEGGGGPGRGPL